MAETRKTTKAKTTTKTKPAVKPAKKPSTKVAPKSTVKKTTKSTSTSRATSNRSNTVTTTHHDNKAGKIILTILISVALIAVVAGIVTAVVCHNRKNDNTVMIENGKNEKIEARYVSLGNYNYSIAVPTSFKTLSADEIKTEYGEQDAPIASFKNESGTINISVTKPQNKLANDQIKEYLEATKTILSTSANVIDTDYYTVDGHNIGTIRASSTDEGKKYYSQMAVFSYEDKLAIITFSCEDKERAEWEKVGQAVIKSLRFNK